MILRAYFFWGLEGLKDQPSGLQHADKEHPIVSRGDRGYS